MPEAIQISPGQSALAALLNSKHIFNVLAAATPGSMGDIFRAISSTGMTPSDLGTGGKTMQTFAKSLANKFTKNKNQAPQHLDNLVNKFEAPDIDRMVGDDIDRDLGEPSGLPENDEPFPEEKNKDEQATKTAPPPPEPFPEEVPQTPENNYKPYPGYPDEQPAYSPYEGQALPGGTIPDDTNQLDTSPDSTKLSSDDYDVPDSSDNQYGDSSKINKKQQKKQTQELEKLIKKAEKTKRKYISPLENKRDNVKNQVKKARKKILRYQQKIAFQLAILATGIPIVLVLLIIGLLLCWCGIGEVLWGWAGAIAQSMLKAIPEITRFTGMIIQETFKIAKFKKVIKSLRRKIQKIQKKINKQIRPKKRQLAKNIEQRQG